MPNMTTKFEPEQWIYQVVIEYIILIFMESRKTLICYLTIIYPDLLETDEMVCITTVVTRQLHAIYYLPI